MPLSGTINGEVTYNKAYFSFYADWSAVQSIEGNYSDVTATTYWATNNTYRNFDTEGKRNASIDINGTNTPISQRFSVYWDNIGDTKYAIQTVTVRVPHEDDGTKQITISARANGTANQYGPSNGTGTSGDCTLSWSGSLDAIPRQARITSASAFNSGSSPSLTYSNPAGSAVSGLHTAIFLTNSVSGTAVTGWKSLNVYGGSYTFSLSDGEKNTLLDNTSGSSRTVYYFVRTKIGNTYYYDSVGKTYTVTLKPTISSSNITVSPDNTSVSSTYRSYFDGMYIQSVSKATVSASATAPRGASISSYSTSLNGVTYSGASFTSQAITASGSVTVTVTATDSRGLSNSASKTITVQSYAKPSVKPVSGESEVRCYRSNSSGTADPGSSTVWLKAARSYSSVNSVNKCLLRYQYRAVGGTYSGWTNLKNWTASGDSYNAALTPTFDVSKAYEININVSDYIGSSVSVVIQIPTDSIPLHLAPGGKNVAFGKYADTTRPNLVESAWNIETAKEGSTAAINRVKNGLASVDLQAAASGNSGIWSKTNSHWLVYDGTDGLTRMQQQYRAYADVSTTPYTLVASDSGRLVRLLNSGAKTVTVPSGLAIGYFVDFMSAYANAKITFNFSGSDGLYVPNGETATSVTVPFGLTAIRLIKVGSTRWSMLNNAPTYYTAGDTITMQDVSHGMGYVTSSGTAMYIDLSLPMPIYNVTQITVTSMIGNCRSALGGYIQYYDGTTRTALATSGSPQWTNLCDSMVFDIYKGHIRMLMNCSNKWQLNGADAVNNSTIVAQFSTINLNLS